MTIEKCKQREKDFKVGDWVFTKKIWGKFQIIKLHILNDGQVVATLNDDTNWGLSMLEHAEPPKEEKHKIEKMPLYGGSQEQMYLYKLADKINELIDTVNELRGV